MKYCRTFWIQASHFNGEQTYRNYHKAIKEKDFDLLHKVLEDCHGHNFKIEVEAELKDVEGFVVDDEALETVVMEWNNVNLTLHKDFKKPLDSGSRVSLEYMVHILLYKIYEIIDNDLLLIKIRIHETPFIYAEEEY